MKLYNKIDRKVLKEQLAQDEQKRVTLSFYQYAHIGNTKIFRDHVYAQWMKIGVYGRVYVAHEGVNAQISVPEATWDDFKKALDDIVFLRDLRLNIAIEDDGKSFYKLKIKVRPKIVADGLNDETFDVTNRGTHLDAEGFNQLTQDENTIIVDMRNHYESEVGHFEDAICPDVDTFREALPVVEQQLEDQKDKNIVMYCTGGIRCEKASAYYKHKGFKNVFQLEGGIIEYTRQVQQKGLDNKFKGKNFVFDDRLGERISEEIISECHQCGKPCDTHTNCANDTCHHLFIQCAECAEKYIGCCTEVCQAFNSLDEETRKELRKGIVPHEKQYVKARTSPFLENKEVQAKVWELVK